MNVISERRHGDLLEREFRLDHIPGLLWTPPGASTAPLILLGHPGGLAGMHPRLVARARRAAQDGIATVTIEQPGAGDRPPSAEADRARSELRSAILGGARPSESAIERLVLPLVDEVVPEWRAVLHELLRLPELGGPVAYSGGVTAVGVRLAAVEPRVVAAGLFAGSAIPLATLEEARSVTVPIHLLLQWDDTANDRQRAIELYDAFGSAEKTLQVNLGGHTGVPEFAGEDAARFFRRHLVG